MSAFLATALSQVNALSLVRGHNFTHFSYQYQITRLPSNLRLTTHEYVLTSNHMTKMVVIQPKTPCHMQTTWAVFYSIGMIAN